MTQPHAIIIIWAFQSPNHVPVRFKCVVIVEHRLCSDTPVVFLRHVTSSWSLPRHPLQTTWNELQEPHGKGTLGERYEFIDATYTHDPGCIPNLVFSCCRTSTSAFEASSVVGGEPTVREEFISTARACKIFENSSTISPLSWLGPGDISG